MPQVYVPAKFIGCSRRQSKKDGESQKWYGELSVAIGQTQSNDAIGGVAETYNMDGSFVDRLRKTSFGSPVVVVVDQMSYTKDGHANVISRVVDVILGELQLPKAA